MHYNIPAIRTMGRSSSTNTIGDSHCQDNQYEWCLSEHARDYDACENMLLNKTDQLYNRMTEESMNMCTIIEIPVVLNHQLSQYNHSWNCPM